METIFAVPMRNNNNNLLDSGLVLLSDWVIVAEIGGIRLRIDCVSIDGGAEILLNYTLFNNSSPTGGGSNSIDVIRKYDMEFGRSDFDNTTEVRCTIETIGSARFSIEALSVAIGEDVPEWV